MILGKPDNNESQVNLVFYCRITIHNEGTKVQNPRRLCCKSDVLYTRQYTCTYADKCVNVLGSIRKFGKDKSSEKYM